MPLKAGRHCFQELFLVSQETIYLEAVQQPLKDAALLALDTGLRASELVALEKTDIHLETTNGAKFGYLRVMSGKSKNATRAVSLTGRVSAMLRIRMAKQRFTVGVSRRREGRRQRLSINVA